jgi:subtilisin family serine protease/subtilisin-like proprotein convertase family protein
MTGEVNQPDLSYQGVGVADENLGTILQRGGEEILLVKVSDRFTVRPADPKQAIDWAATIPSQQHKSVPRSDLEVFTVDPENLEAAMEQARSLAAVEFVSHLYQGQNDPGLLVYLSNEITIQFADDVDEATQGAIASAVGLKLERPLEGIPNTFIFELTPDCRENPIKIANRLMRSAQVLTAEPNIIIETQSHYRPKDNLYYKQWYLNHNGGSQLAANSHINVEPAWDITRGLRSVVVAITDDSIDINHPDFQGLGKIVAPRDLKDRDFVPLPDTAEDNHGTSCAGVAVAEENGHGIVGVAPGCALMPIRTTGYLDDKSIEDLFEWAQTKGASVISCSWGASAVHFPLSLRQKAAVTRAATQGRNGKGCVIVFAAGNSNRPTDDVVNESGWPNNVISGRTQWLSGFAIHPDVITVSACTSLSKKSAYSNWGKSISVCAPSNNAPPGIWLPETGYISTAPQITQSLPGLGIFTTDRVGSAGYDQGDFTGYFGGTSSACPVVAGVAALVLSANPDLTAREVKQILEQTADKIVDRDPDPQLGIKLGTYDTNGHSQWFGYGKVNAGSAVAYAHRQYNVRRWISRWTKQRISEAFRIPDYQKSGSSLFPFNLFGSSNPEGITSEVSMGDSGVVQQIEVKVSIIHDFLGDIEIYLMAPNQNVVQLQSRTLGRQTQLYQTYNFQNAPTLRKFIGLSAKGTWKLIVVDCVPGDTGTLNNWELNLGF